jgi:hypothetical protein
MLIIGGDDENTLMLTMAMGWNDWQVENHVECVDGPETGPGQ